MFTSFTSLEILLGVGVFLLAANELRGVLGDGVEKWEAHEMSLKEIYLVLAKGFRRGGEFSTEEAA